MNPSSRRHLRVLVLGYALIALLAAASVLLPQVSALWLGVLALLLAVPVSLAMWHGFAVRQLIALHQFQPGVALHWWGGRRAIGVLWRAAVGIAVGAAVLFQSVFFGWLEWALLVVAPWAYLLGLRIVDSGTAGQFTLPVYRSRWSLVLVQWLVTLGLALTWIVLRLWLAEDPAGQLLERVSAWQSRWDTAPSGAVKWALDAGAWGHATVDSVGHLADGSGWRVLLLMVFAPVSVFGYMAVALSGMSLPLAELRRTFAKDLTADTSPAPVGPSAAALWAAVATVVAISLLQLLGAVDHRLRAEDSPLAIRAVPTCERIDGKVYVVNTIGALRALLRESRGEIAGRQVEACQGLSEIEFLAARGVDAYLDWYFSLGAEWSRFITLLTGDVDLLLQAKFSQMVMSSPEIAERLSIVQRSYEAQWEHLVGARSRALDLLSRNRLILDESQCKVIEEFSMTQVTAQWDTSQARLVSGSGAGLVAGVLAAKVTTKAMGKTAMKTAAVALTKAAAKKGVGKALATAAGAVIGTLAAPGLGTAAGAVIGAGTGVAVGVGIDLVALMAEEGLTRDDMRTQLLNAVSESLQPYRDSLTCSAFSGGLGVRPR